jgi:hypothetical protein
LRTPSLERSRISGAPLHFVPRCTASGTREIGRRAFILALAGADQPLNRHDPLARAAAGTPGRGVRPLDSRLRGNERRRVPGAGGL